VNRREALVKKLRVRS